MSKVKMPKWYDKEGNIIACTEKIKVMQENMLELQQSAQDTFEDALLMGCEEQQIRQYLLELINNLDNPYRQS